MKTLLVGVSLALVGVGSAQAQMFRPSVGSGAVVGAVAGGLIGGHNGDRWAEGAVLGAAAGAIIGAALTPRESVYAPTPAPVYRTQTYAHPVYTHQVVTAPTVPDAPSAYSAPVVVQQPAPQIVYVERAPSVVYVPVPPPRPRVVYVAPRPVVSFGYTHYSGPRHYGHHRPHHWHRHGPPRYCR